MYLAENRKAFSGREYVLPTGTRISIICIMERESSLGRLALDHLDREGFGVRTLSMGTDVIQRMEQLHPSLVIIRNYDV